jgi:hypothetical protein
MLVSGDGRFVYGGNRLQDSCGLFAPGVTGDLTFAGEEWTGVITHAASISILPVGSSIGATGVATTWRSFA